MTKEEFEKDLAKEYKLTKREILDIFSITLCEFLSIDPENVEEIREIREIRDGCYSALNDSLEVFHEYQEDLNNKVKDLFN